MKYTELTEILVHKQQLQSVYLGKHWFTMMCNHGSLLTVKDNRCVVEGFFWMFDDVVEVSDATFKDTTEVSWN